MKTVLALIALALPLAAYETATLEKTEKLVADKKCQILDVRTEGEWEKGRLDRAIRIDWFQDGFDEKAKAALKIDRPVLVYCHSGGRSSQAAERLEELGFAVVYDYAGGMDEWTKSGKKVVK